MDDLEKEKLVSILDDDFYETFLEKEQELFTSGDYLDESNQVFMWKTQLEQQTDEELSPDQKMTKYNILWLWYHHASQKIFRGDKEKAIEYIDKALEYQSNIPEHPNKITGLLKILYEGRIEDAREFAQSIENEIEKETSDSLITYFVDRGLSI